MSYYYLDTLRVASKQSNSGLEASQSGRFPGASRSLRDLGTIEAITPAFLEVGKYPIL